LQLIETRGVCSRYFAQRPRGAIAHDPVLAAKPAYILAAEGDQNDACEDEMNALFEFPTTEPAICPMA